MEQSNIKKICINCLLGTCNVASILLSSLITIYSFMHDNCNSKIEIPLNNTTSANNYIVESMCNSSDNTKQILSILVLIMSVTMSLKSFIDNKTKNNLEKIVVEKEDVIKNKIYEIETMSEQLNNRMNEPYGFEHNIIPQYLNNIPSTRETIYSPDIIINE